MGQTLEPIDDASGRSLGCILQREGAIIAIRPDGSHRDCGDRQSAISWLEETAGRQDHKHQSRAPDMVEWFVMAITAASLLFYVFLAVRT